MIVFGDGDWVVVVVVVVVTASFSVTDEIWTFPSKKRLRTPVGDRTRNLLMTSETL